MSKFDFKKFFKDLDRNILFMGIAIVAVGVIGALILTNGNRGLGQFLDKIKSFTLMSMSKGDLAKKGIDYINNNVLSGQTATLVSTSEESGLVKIKINIGGKEFDSYISKDGKLLFPEAIRLDEVIKTPEQ